MAPTPSRDDLARVRKLARLPDEIRATRFDVSITRLTVLKSLCREQATANRFVLYLARRTLDRIHNGKGRSTRTDSPKDRAHLGMMEEAVALMDAWLEEPTTALRQQMRALVGRMQAEQNEHKSVPFGAVRLITDWELLLFEKALHCFVRTEEEAGQWSYQMARDFAERYESGAGTGLVSASIPFVRDIIDFWVEWFRLDATPPMAAQTSPAGKEPADQTVNQQASRTEPEKRRANRATFTPRQGQYLAFIHLYRKLHRQSPAEPDMVLYFRVTLQAVHNMLVKLEESGLVKRTGGEARSVRVTVPEARIPALEEVKGPPW
jgi:DNA-binding MarR family transcriptional regulator